MNAIRAARKIVKELGGVDKCVSIVVSESVSSGKQYTNNSTTGQGFDWGFWQSNPFEEMIRRRTEEMRREKEAQAAKQREAAKERAERLRRQAEQTMNNQRTNIYDGMFTDEQRDAIRQMIIEMLGGKA